MGARHELLLQIPGIVDDCRDEEPFVAVGRLEPVVVLRDSGVLAVRHAIFPQPCWPQIRRHDSERAESRATPPRATSAAPAAPAATTSTRTTTTTATGELPVRHRI